MKSCLKTLFSSMLFLTVATTAHGQNPYARPTVSPWLNLHNGTNSPALNYYNLVRPEFDFRSSIQQLQQQAGVTQQAIADLAAPTGLPATGTGASFMTHTSYFQTRGGSGVLTPFGVSSGGQQRPTTSFNKPITR